MIQTVVQGRILRPLDFVAVYLAVVEGIEISIYDLETFVALFIRCLHLRLLVSHFCIEICLLLKRQYTL